MTLNVLNKSTITSLELLEQINIFRKEEETRLTNHKDLLIIIETEFTDVNRKRVEGGVCPKSLALISQQLQQEGIQISSYTHPQNKQEYPLYILSTGQAKQCLIKESKIVRKAMIKYIEELENKIKTPETFLEAMQLATQLLLDKEKVAKELLESNLKIKKLTHTDKLYTSSELAKELGYRSASSFNQHLSDLKVQYKVNNTWLLVAKYADLGYTSIKQLELESGKIIYDRKFTGLGREFLIELLKKLEFDEKF